jgi:hypothetical protein
MLLFLMHAPEIYGQDTIRISATVTDLDTKAAVSNLMVVNMRTQEGAYVGSGGKFELNMLKSDTLILASLGFSTMRLSFRDSVLKSVYTLRIFMKRLEFSLKPVDIISPRDLEEIQKDIDKLGYKESDYMIGGVAAFESPITYLYQQFSRRERNKREVAEMRNNDRRRELLKELFRKYVDAEIISLEDEEFDDFIDFCRVSDEFMKSSTQYEFIMYVKKRFELYRMINGSH